MILQTVGTDKVVKKKLSLVLTAVRTDNHITWITILNYPTSHAQHQMCNLVAFCFIGCDW